LEPTSARKKAFKIVDESGCNQSNVSYYDGEPIITTARGKEQIDEL
jgi:hypothetical protein